MTNRPRPTRDAGETLDRTRASLARSRQLIEEIRSGLERHDKTTLGVKARRLRALLAPLGAEGAVEAARRLEAATSGDDRSSTEAAVDAVTRAIARLSDES